MGNGKETDTRPVRRHLAHPPPVSRHNTPVILFVTVCVSKKRNLLANAATHERLLRAWQEADAWHVGRYVIMPDHIHFFCAPCDPECTLKRWMSFWRNRFTRQWTNENDKPIWQRDFWDTQLRRNENYHDKWIYVSQNPVRAHLVSHEGEWPYAGEINILRW